MVILAETLMFLPKVVYFGRNKTISAEIRQFQPNIQFWPNFGFCEGPVSVFGVSAKNLFRSNTSRMCNVPSSPLPHFLPPEQEW